MGVIITSFLVRFTSGPALLSLKDLAIYESYTYTVAVAPLAFIRTDKLNDPKTCIGVFWQLFSQGSSPPTKLTKPSHRPFFTLDLRFHLRILGSKHPRRPFSFSHNFLKGILNTAFHLTPLLNGF
jgi:hypothetical protein